MNQRIPDTHAEAWDLIPWLANGRLAAADREWVEAHLQSCVECRVELTTQREIAQRMHAAGEVPVVGDEQRSFDKLWSRIEASESAGAVSTGTGSLAPARRGSRTVRWLAAAVIVQGFGLALFGLQALRGADAPRDDFRTVSTVEAVRGATPEVRIVFAPEATIGTINALLARQGLTLVSGPGESGNFTAALTAAAVATGASAESVADQISRDPNVAFAQPVAR